MSKKLNHIDQIARDKLLDSRVEPPAYAWGNMANELEQMKSRKKVILFRKLTGIAATIIILIGIGFIFITPNNIDKKVATIQTPIDSVQKSTPENDSLTFKSDSIYKSKPTIINTIVNEESINLLEQKTINTEIANQEISLSFLKMQNLILPLNSIESSETQTVDNYLDNKIASIKNWSPIEYATETTISKKRTWKLGLGYSPSYSTMNSPTADVKQYGGRPITGSDINGANGVNEEILDVNEQLIPSFTVGVNFSYSLSDRLSIISGVYYLNQKNEIENFYVIENTANDISEYYTNSSLGNIRISKNDAINNGAIFSNNIELSSYTNLANSNSNLIQSFEYIEIPLLLSFKLLKNKYSIALIGGFNTGILVGNNVYLKNNQSDRIGTTDNTNNLIFKSVIGFSFEYPLTKRLFFTIAPSYKYQLNNLNKASVRNYHLQFFDVKTGISFQF